MTHWNKAKAAELLEISRSRLYRKVKAYGLVPNLFPAQAQVHDALVVTADANH
jgi:DNA-binding NtrC family response regulator